MKIKLGSILLTFLIPLLMQGDENGYLHIDNKSFDADEKLEYRVHLGFLSGAYATIEISETIYTINNRPCFRVNVFGKTAGVIDLFYKVRDTWGTYLDTAAIVPQQADTFNIGLRFTQGVEELPGIIEEVKVAGAAKACIERAVMRLRRGHGHSPQGRRWRR